MKNVMFKTQITSIKYMYVAKSIVIDFKGINFDKNVYLVKVDLISSQQDSSPIQPKLLKCKSYSRTKHSLEAVLLENIITSIVAKSGTSLQLALAIMIDKKSINMHLYDFGVTCLYNELIRFHIICYNMDSKSKNN